MFIKAKNLRCGLPRRMSLETPLRRAFGFTLVELMIAIAMSLLIIIGINSIFRMSAQTIGAGVQAAALGREHRDAEAVMSNDFLNFADPTQQPALIIQNMNTVAFMDAADEKSDSIYDRTKTTQADLNTVTAAALSITTDGGKTAPFIQPAVPGAGPVAFQRAAITSTRNHRTDILSFFTHGSYRRQTGNFSAGNPTPRHMDFADINYEAHDAWVFYGHLLQPDNQAPTAVAPGPSTRYRMLPPGIVVEPVTNGQILNSSTNPNNFYARQWNLGRSVVLLDQPTVASATTGLVGSSIRDSNDVVQNAVGEFPASPLQPVPQPLNLQPIEWGQKTGNVSKAWYGGTHKYLIQESRCDLASVSAPNGLTYQGKAPTSTLQIMQAKADFLAKGAGAAIGNGWFWPLLTQKGGFGTLPAGPEFAYRFESKPWLSKTTYGKNLGSTAGVDGITEDQMYDMALTSPIFMRGCTQFIVEFAGDYLDQTSVVFPGKPLPKKDDEIDYDLVKIPGPAGLPTYFKRIRWYGVARSLDGGGIDNADPSVDIAATLPASVNAGRQVLPVFKYLGTAVTSRLPFEYPTGGGTLNTGFPRTGNTPTNVKGYTCAWSPSEMRKRVAIDTDFATYPNGYLPWLIRLTIRLDDPNGRLPEGQTVEYIYKLPR